MPGLAQRRSLVSISVGVVAVAAMLTGAYYAKQAADERSTLTSINTTEAATRVTVYEVAYHDLPVRVDVRGFLEGSAEVRVRAEVAGAVAERPVNDGDAVAAGQVLCRVDDTFHRIAAQQAQAELQSAQAGVDQARAAIEAAAARVENVQVHRRNAQIEFDRVRELYEEQSAPQIEYDRFETALQQADAAVREAQAALRRANQQRASAAAGVALAEARLAQAQETLARCDIRAPLAGRVDRMLVEQGEYVVPGQPIADVIRLDCMKLMVEVSAAQLALLGTEPTAELVVDAVPEAVHRASLHHVAPRADPVSRKFRLELQVENPDGALLSGMFAQCRLTAAKTRRLVVLPAAAVVSRFGRDYCHVVSQEEDGLRVRLRPVEVRPVPDLVDQLELLEGLAVGEQVVIAAQAELRDGAAVAVAEPAPGPSGSAHAEVGPHPDTPRPLPGGEDSASR